MIHMKSFEAVCCGKATVSGESARETKGDLCVPFYLFTFNQKFVWGNLDLCHDLIFCPRFLSTIFFSIQGK